MVKETSGRSKGWKTTPPPRRLGRINDKPVKLRFQDNRGMIYHGKFFWCNRENTWVECDDEDGIGIYDDYKVLGWK